MTNKHTPGPWRFKKNGRDTYILSGPDGVGPTELAKVRAANSLPVEKNAALIAAAPEMLAALEAFIDEANTRDVRAMARAAIARARGKA